MKQQPQHLRSTSTNVSRLLNKYFFNRIVLTNTKSGKGPLSVVYHIGRQSGRTYQTPVLASYVEDKIVIPLSYGENVDWLRNVLAQGSCEISHKNRRMGATNPEVIDSAVALAILPEKRRKLFERTKEEKFLRLQVINKK
jgi:deazaflavin-dependent oxidoreductase (nitroreductase family)